VGNDLSIKEKIVNRPKETGKLKKWKRRLESVRLSVNNYKRRRSGGGGVGGKKREYSNGRKNNRNLFNLGLKNRMEKKWKKTKNRTKKGSDKMWD